MRLITFGSVTAPLSPLMRACWVLGSSGRPWPQLSGCTAFELHRYQLGGTGAESSR